MGITASLAAAAGAVAALSGVTTIVWAIGFKATGILAGSIAAAMMRILGGATTAAGGIVATLQSIGATSILSSTVASVITVVVGAVCGYFVYLRFF